MIYGFVLCVSDLRTRWLTNTKSYLSFNILSLTIELTPRLILDCSFISLVSYAVIALYASLHLLERILVAANR